MGLFKKKTVIKTYDKENKKPVIKASICNGEQVAGFKDIHTGKIEEVMLIKSQADLDEFKKMYGIDGEIERSIDMSILGNILWFICGGLLSGLSWIVAGCLWCISIIGIPIGLQCFKFAGLVFFPFGKEVVYGGGTISFLANITLSV